MRNLLIAVIIISILSLVCIYLFIPSRINFSRVVIIKTKTDIANRFLIDQSKWGKWFPTDPAKSLPGITGNNGYRYKNYVYSIGRKMMNAAEIPISNNSDTSLKSLINMFSFSGDSTAIEWKGELPESSNPINRVKNYLTARKLQNDMGDILHELQKFLSEDDKVYGIHLHEIISKDSTLIATQATTTHYPSTGDIYNLINSLKKYIASQGAKENNFPMLHVKKVDSTRFETMVAIPVNKHLEGNDSLFFKRFVPWKVLTAEVKGGVYTVNEALDQMDIYMNDNNKQEMAIPFESLVTDRSRQPDTSQWITRIYTPVP